VINIVAPCSGLILTRQLAPGISRVPQLLQMNILSFFGSRTPAFMPIKRAISRYFFERSGSSTKLCLASWISMSIRSRAISRVFPGFHTKQARNLFFGYALGRY